MKRSSSVRAAVFVFVSLFQLLVFAGGRFPMHPEPAMTPGSLCENSTVRRYKENIIYCERQVETSTKNQIINEYDRQFGYEIRAMSRGEFKIDHFIPLSLGGSNNPDNLWPQHKSVYKETDPLEHALFEKLNDGRITQAEAIKLIKEAKLNTGRAPELLDYVQSM